MLSRLLHWWIFFNDLLKAERKEGSLFRLMKVTFIFSSVPEPLLCKRGVGCTCGHLRASRVFFVSVPLYILNDAKKCKIQQQVVISKNQ